MKSKRKIVVPATPVRQLPMPLVEEEEQPPPPRVRRRQPINRVPKDKVRRDDADWNF